LSVGKYIITLQYNEHYYAFIRGMVDANDACVAEDLWDALAHCIVPSYVP
jgi:hypothetical protein